MLLKDIELFKELSAVEQSRLLGCMEKMEIPCGEMIFCQGDTGDGMYVVASGQIELFTADEQGKEHVLVHLDAGEAFGEMALLTGEARTASARVLVGALLYKMSREAFDRHLAENSTVSLYMIKLLSRRLASTNTRLKKTENQKDEMVLKELERLPSDAQKIVLSVAVLPVCTRAFLQEYFGVRRQDESIYKYLREGTEGDIATVCVAEQVKDALCKIYHTRFDDTEKNRLTEAAVADYLSGGMTGAAVRLMAERKRWPELIGLLEKMVGENAPDKGLVQEITGCIRYCPDEALASSKKVLKFLLEAWLSVAPELGFHKMEDTLQNADRFDPEEKAELYGLAARYCKRLGYRQKSLEYLNMASSIAGAMNWAKGTEGKWQEDAEREYGFAEKKYKTAFGIAMAEQVRKHSFKKKGAAVLLAAVISLAAVGYFSFAAPVGGLSREAMIFIGISLAAVAFWIVNAIPPYIVALLMVFFWIVSGLVAPQDALSGFSSPVWLYMVCIFAFGTAISKSGLLYRLSLCILRAFPKSYSGQLTGLAVSGMIFAPLIPSSTAKVALSSSISQSISEAMGLEDRSKGAAGLGLCAMIFYGYTSSFFLTGSYINLMAWELVPHGGSISWLQWFFYSLFPFLLFSLGMYAAILLLFKPRKMKKEISGEVLKEQLKILGKLEGQELTTAVVAAGVILMLATQSWHQLDSAWILLGSVAVLVISGVLDNNAIKSGIDWPFLLFMGVSFSLVNLLSGFGIVEAMTVFLESAMEPFMASPYAFLPVVVLLGFLVTFVIRDEPAVILLVVSMIPITGSTGIHPWVLVLAILLSTDPFFFPYQSATYLTAYYSSQEKAFSNRQGQRLALCFGAVVLLAVFFSIPYWELMGLIK